MAKFFLHESSYVDDNIKIGENTKIWHFSHVLSGSSIGKNCSFGQNCVVGPNAKIRSGAKVQNNISICEGVVIEDDVFLGSSMVFTNVINPRSFITRKEEFKTTLFKKGCSIGAGLVINKEVKDFALIVNVTGKQIGWVSILGNKLKFNEKNIAIDAFDNSRYELKNEILTLV